MEIVPKNIESYAEEYSSEESELLQELVKTSKIQLDHTDMLSGRVVGRLLALLISISGARRVLDIGTFTGYSALSMAEAMPGDGELITCEYNRRYEKIARFYFDKSEHGHKITLEMGPALQTLEKIEGPFDFAYLDADKVNYPRYYQLLKPMLAGGALMVIDNVLWSGSVLDPEDEKEMAIDRLNRLIYEDDEVVQVMLTVRDGVTILRKK